MRGRALNLVPGAVIIMSKPRPLSRLRLGLGNSLLCPCNHCLLIENAVHTFLFNHSL